MTTIQYSTLWTNWTGLNWIVSSKCISFFPISVFTSRSAARIIRWCTLSWWTSPSDWRRTNRFCVTTTPQSSRTASSWHVSMAAGPSLAPSSGPRAHWWGARSSSQWSSSLSTCPSCASRSAALKGETDGVQTDTSDQRDRCLWERSNRCVPYRMGLYPLMGASHTKVCTRKFNGGIQERVWMWMEKAMCELVNGPVFYPSVYSKSVFALMWSSSDAPSALLTCPGCVDKAEVMLWMRTSRHIEIRLNRAPSGRSRNFLQSDWDKSNPEAQRSKYAVMLWGLDYTSWPLDRRDSIPRSYCVVICLDHLTPM